jgi:hypothetical protein
MVHGGDAIVRSSACLFTLLAALCGTGSVRDRKSLAVRRRIPPGLIRSDVTSLALEIIDIGDPRLTPVSSFCSAVSHAIDGNFHAQGTNGSGKSPVIVGGAFDVRVPSGGR